MPKKRVEPGTRTRIYSYRLSYTFVCRAGISHATSSPNCTAVLLYAGINYPESSVGSAVSLSFDGIWIPSRVLIIHFSILFWILVFWSILKLV